MPGFIIRIIVNAVAIAITAFILPGIEVRGGVVSYLIIGLIFGIINALVRPIVKLLTCPLIIVTLGLFILVINGAMLMLTGAISGDRLFVDGWLSAILGGIIMGVVNVILEAVTGLNKDE